MKQQVRSCSAIAGIVVGITSNDCDNSGKLGEQMAH